MNESIIFEYVRELLREDPMGFVHDLAASDKFGDDFFGGRINKEAGREIKRAYANNADYQFLNSLNTVHWTTTYALTGLAGKGKDELSATMSLPGDEFVPAAGLEVGLWIKGRITLATNDQDKMYSGFHGDYGAPHEGSEEEVAHRDKSSGRNKRPTMSKDFSRYGQLKRGTEFGEKMARNMAYILDQSTFHPVEGGWGVVNEALVDNWTPHAIVIDHRHSDAIEAMSGYSSEEIMALSAGTAKQIFSLANELGIPIVNLSQDELWSPGKKEIKDESIRAYIRELLTEQEVKYQGILKLTPTVAIVNSISSLLQQLPPEAVPLPEDKFHVTLAHQSVLKPYRKQLKQLSKDGMLPPPPTVVLENIIEERVDETLDRKSWVVWVSNQDELKAYVQDVIQSMGGPPGDPEPARRFHVSVANLTGHPGDSVR